MHYLLLGIFVLVTAIPWFVRTSPKILHPLNVFVIMQLLLIVPGVLIALADPRAMDARIVNSVGGDFDAAMSWTLVLFIVLNLTIYGAFYFWRARQPVVHPDISPLEERAYDSYLYVGALVGLMLVSFALKAWMAGGFGFLLDNLANRVELQRGVGAFSIIENGSRLLACFIVTRIALLRRDPFAWMVMAGVVAFCFVLGGIFGSRKGALDIMVLVALTVSFYAPHFFRVSLRNVMAVAGGYVVIAVLLLLGLIYRNSNAQIDFAYVLSSSWFDIKEMLVTESYIGTYYFITNFFDATSYYYWSLVADLRGLFLPSAMFPDKPITDDGVYIKHAIQGIMLPPQTPVQLVILDSNPPETLGGAYMNGGPFVVPVYGLILGSVFAFFLGRAERYPNAPIWVLLTIWVFTTFEISNLRLAQILTLTIALLFVRLMLKPLEVAALPRLKAAH